MDKKYSPIASIEEILPFLNKITVFNGLNNSQLEKVCKLLKTVKYETGEYIYKRGDCLNNIYIIKQGEVNMIFDDKGLFLKLISFKDGDCFGETSVIGILTHSSNALIARPTELIVLEPNKLLKIYETDKEIFGLLILNIARETSRRLHQSNEALIQHMISKK
jgi:CRP/FNR family transcriptional regulator, cyclic AMP receptor protein